MLPFVLQSKFSLLPCIRLPQWLEPYHSIIHEFKYPLIILSIIISMIVLARILRRLLKRYFERHENVENSNKTNYQFLMNGISFIFFLLGVILIFYTIPSLRALGLTLFAGAGIFAAIIGFASQQAFSNIVGGIFIVIFKPFRVNDIVKVGGGDWGMVEDITLRHTVIKSFENRRYIIPNSTMSAETILNSSISDSRVCVFVEMGISYDSDVDLAMSILQEEGEKHPNFIDNREEQEKENNVPAIVTRLIGFGDSSVNIRAYVWAEDPIKGFVMKTDLYKSIKSRFDKEGIEIPFPYRTIVYKDEKKESNDK